jgi:hypothetical protein
LSKIKSSSAGGIWKQLKHKMNNTCEKENCWLEQPFMRGKIDKEMEDLILIPGFELHQVKLKFNMARFYFETNW